MSLLKALSKAILRSGNDFLLAADQKQATQRAYNNVGSLMRNSRSYVNGKAAYKKELRLQMLKAEQKHINREKFISDL